MRTILTFLSILVYTALQAATGTIHSVKLEQGIKVRNLDAMKVHCSFTMRDAVNEQCYLAVWIRKPSGEWVRVNTTHKSQAGIEFFRKKVTPKSNPEYFPDATVTIFMQDIYLSPGTNDYSVIVTMHDSKGNIITQANPVPFTATKKNPPAQAPAYPAQPSYTPAPDNNSRQQPVQCRYCQGSGVSTNVLEGYAATGCLAEDIGYLSPSQNRCPFCTRTNFHVHTKCGYCRGTGYK